MIERYRNVIIWSLLVTLGPIATVAANTLDDLLASKKGLFPASGAQTIKDYSIPMVEKLELEVKTKEDIEEKFEMKKHLTVRIAPKNLWQYRLEKNIYRLNNQKIKEMSNTYKNSYYASIYQNYLNYLVAKEKIQTTDTLVKVYGDLLKVYQGESRDGQEKAMRVLRVRGDLELAKVELSTEERRLETLAEKLGIEKTDDQFAQYDLAPIEQALKDEGDHRQFKHTLEIEQKLAQHKFELEKNERYQVMNHVDVSIDRTNKGDTKTALSFRFQLPFISQGGQNLQEKAMDYYKSKMGNHLAMEKFQLELKEYKRGMERGRDALNKLGLNSLTKAYEKLVRLFKRPNLKETQRILEIKETIEKMKLRRLELKHRVYQDYITWLSIQSKFSDSEGRNYLVKYE